jgi:thiosulfate/3-mercaptopyruvate sulfurtransferase
MTHSTLIDTEALARRLDDPDIVIVDCRFDLADPGAGDRAFAASHVPGAVYAHLDRDLAGTKTGTNGRHPLPSAESAAATFGRFGIGAGSQVVVYDQDSGMFASRLWWMLRWLGHDAAAVLDGGFARWVAEGRPTSTDVATPRPRTFVPSPRPDFVVTAAEVPSFASAPDARVVDARAPERYRGEIEPIDPVAGHIPGAVNYFYQRSLEDGRFRTPDALREEFRASLGEVRGDRIVCYCGSGVTACHNVLALEHAGVRGARVYAGSWSEWVADPSRPVERG